MTCKISGAWVVTRTCPYDGTESTLGVFPEGKAALLKLEHFMDDPSDNEEYKVEFHMFESVEQLIEQHQRCKANRAEWDEKTKVYDEYKRDQDRKQDQAKEIDKLLENEYVTSDT